MVAMMIEDLLTDLGFTIAGRAVTADEAMEVVRLGDIDFALLDVNLGEGETSFAVAAHLGECGIPFAWVTGYGTRGVPERFGHAPILDKPIDPDLFAKVVRGLA